MPEQSRAELQAVTMVNEGQGRVSYLTLFPSSRQNVWELTMCPGPISGIRPHPQLTPFNKIISRFFLLRLSLCMGLSVTLKGKREKWKCKQLYILQVQNKFQTLSQLNQNWVWEARMQQLCPMIELSGGQPVAFASASVTFLKRLVRKGIMQVPSL